MTEIKPGVVLTRSGGVNCWSVDVGEDIRMVSHLHFAQAQQD